MRFSNICIKVACFLMTIFCVLNECLEGKSWDYYRRSSSSCHSSANICSQHKSFTQSCSFRQAFPSPLKPFCDVTTHLSICKQVTDSWLDFSNQMEFLESRNENECQLLTWSRRQVKTALTLEARIAGCTTSQQHKKIKFYQPPITIYYVLLASNNDFGDMG